MFPKLFGIIDSYAVMMVIGLVLSIVLFEVYFRTHFKEDKGKLYLLEVALLLSVASGLLGAYLFQNLYDFILNPSQYHWEWSMTFFGGLLMGAIAFFLFYALWLRKRYPSSLGKVLLIAPSCIALAHGFGRIGCFLEGCCYGVKTDAWYGLKFVTTTEKVVPTNLFEAIFLLALLIPLLLLAFKKQSQYGMPIYLLAYGVFRFTIEFWRDDPRGAFIPGISPSQFWAILAILIGIALFAYYLAKQRNERYGRAVK